MRQTEFYLVAVHDQLQQQQVTRNMEGGNFYSRGTTATGHGVHFGGTSNYYGIPDHVRGPSPMPSQAMVGYVDVNQKLDRLIGLVQTQQKETETIKSNMEKFQEEFNALKSSVSANQLQSTPVSKRIPSKLSIKVKHLQDKSAEDMKFTGDQPYNSEHNTKVKDDLIHKLSLEYSNDYSPRKIKKAVHRYYESRRRIFNDSRPDRLSSAQKAKRDSRKKEMRKRLYSSRKRYLKREKEKKLWEEINWEYMTEESSGDDNVLNKHVLSWRSEALNHLVEKLEKRAAKDSVASKCRYKRKERIEKSPSRCSMPSHAPKWAIKSSISTTTVSPSTTTTISPSATTTVSLSATTTVSPSTTTTVSPSATTTISPSVTVAVTPSVGTSMASYTGTPHSKRHKEAISSRRYLDFLMSSEDSSSSSLSSDDS